MLEEHKAGRVQCWKSTVMEEYIECWKNTILEETYAKNFNILLSVAVWLIHTKLYSGPTSHWDSSDPKIH